MANSRDLRRGSASWPSKGARERTESPKGVAPPLAPPSPAAAARPPAPLTITVAAEIVAVATVVGNAPPTACPAVPPKSPPKSPPVSASVGRFWPKTAFFSGLATPSFSTSFSRSSAIRPETSLPVLSPSTKVSIALPPVDLRSSQATFCRSSAVPRSAVAAACARICSAMSPV